MVFKIISLKVAEEDAAAMSDSTYGMWGPDIVLNVDVFENITNTSNVLEDTLILQILV